jgi:hypothetical protein
MNIIEAMKKVEENQSFALRKNDQSISLHSNGGNLLHARDILADDWEVLE